MTAASNEVVAVTHADRDMVQAFHRLRLNKLMEAIKDEKAGARLGEDEGDAGDLVQAFARHRIAHSDPRPVAEGLRGAIIAAITEADGRFGYSYRLTKMDETGEEHTLFMDGFEPAVFEDRADGYPVLEQRRNTLRTDAILAALATHSPAPMAGEGFAQIAECAFDDRPRSRVGHPSHMDWEDGFRDGTRAAAAAIRAAAHPSTQEGGK